MRQLSLGVFRLDGSFQQSREPNLVRVGHWDIIRRRVDQPVFGLAEDELVARLVGLSQENQQWVAVSWEGFRLHVRRDSRLPQPITLIELRERHRTGDMADPDLTRFPVSTALEPGKGGMPSLMNGFRRLSEESRDVVLVHKEGGPAAISLHPRALRRILELQR